MHLAAVLKHRFVHHVRYSQENFGCKCLIESKLTHSYNMTLIKYLSAFVFWQRISIPFSWSYCLICDIYFCCPRQFSSARNLTNSRLTFSGLNIPLRKRPVFHVKSVRPSHQRTLPSHVWIASLATAMSALLTVIRGVPQGPNMSTSVPRIISGQR